LTTISRFRLAFSEVRMSLTSLLVALAILGSLTVATAAAPLSPEDAKSHIGETATVCGVVVSSEYEANEQIAADVIGSRDALS
jgi:hypothetical protein